MKKIMIGKKPNIIRNLFQKYITLIFTFSIDIFSQSAITYEITNGRLGDRLLGYCKAKYISQKYNIPLLYKPFKYTDEMTMHVNEVHYDKVDLDWVQKVINIEDHLNFIPNDIGKNILYVVTKNHYNFYNGYPYFGIPKDKIFIDALKKNITPLSSYKVLTSTDIHTIALHIRRGGGYDSESSVAVDKMKWPTIDFYIQALNKLLEVVPLNKAYIYIFTDDLTPRSLALTLGDYYKNYQFEFYYRASENRHDRNVLEDLFSMAQCDYLIRPKYSGFSIIADLIGNHRVIIYPLSTRWSNKGLEYELEVVKSNL